MARRKRKPRRGVLLLVILSSLVLFALMGITFVVIAGHYRRSAALLAKPRITIAEARGELDDAFMQLAVGTLNRRSVIEGHDLLGDMYGNDGLRGVIPSGLRIKWADGGGQLLLFRFKADPLILQPGKLLLNPTPGYYSGSILTMLDGPAKGLSTRVVGYLPVLPIAPGGPIVWGELVVKAFDGATIPNNDFRPVDQHFMINGRPFNGTGLGYNPDPLNGVSLLNLPAYELNPYGVPVPNPQTGLPVPLGPVALMPNHSAYSPLNLPPVGVTPSLVNPPLMWPKWAVDAGGADESYDAVDFQNMFLAMVPPPVDRTADLALGPVLNAANVALVDVNGDGRITIDDVGRPVDANGVSLVDSDGMITLADVDLNGDGKFTSVDLAFTSADIIPSFHRPALVNYWTRQAPGDPASPLNHIQLRQQFMRRVMRRVIMRPLQAIHFNFTGSNPSWNVDQVDNITRVFVPGSATGGDGIPDDNRVWDVDNDNDNVPDSVWVDLGLPVKTAPDGRRYKPLFAILCVDMDGRLNLNAHGSRWDYWRRPPAVAMAGGLWSNDPTLGLSRGQGYGPPEISLGPLFFNLGDYQNLLENGGNFSRYGIDKQPGARLYDAFAQLKFSDHPADYFDPSGPRTAFGSLPDLAGRFAVGLDQRGQPISEWNQTWLGTDYETDLSLSAPRGVSGQLDRDNPFTPGELEGVLRFGDVDAAALPDRLRTMVSAFNSDVKNALHNRRIVTTDSFDVPVPNVVLPPEFRSFVALMLPGIPDFRNPDGILFNQNGSPTTGPDGIFGNGDELFAGPDRILRTADDFTSLTIVDVLKARLLLDGVRPLNLTAVPPVLQPFDLDSQLRLMLPPEVIRGERMDVNRPFGNGRDDNTNINQAGFGVVDEPGEYLGPDQLLNTGDDIFEPAWPPMGSPKRFNAAQFANRFNNNIVQFDNIDNQPQPPPGISPLPAFDQAKIFARQIYARHLYCLMMLLMDRNYLHPVTEPEIVNDPNSAKRRAVRQELTARQIAQWAINVVDFRDSDAIMTPFEYDVNPFNGWTVDGDVATNEFRDGGPNMTLGDADDVLGLERRVVWGCENPEVILTETLALHDLRVKDTGAGLGMMGPDILTEDQTMDQVRIPQGSLFLELYCTRSARLNGAGLPRELYTPNPLNSNTLELDLGRVTPIGGSPVWRVAIGARPKQDGVPSPVDSAAKRALLRPDTVAFNPADMNRLDVVNGISLPNEPLSPSPIPPLLIPDPGVERVIWFTNTVTPQTAALPDVKGRVFYNRVPNRWIAPGGYMVVGPRETTFLGSSTTPGENSTQWIRLDPDPAAAFPVRVEGANLLFPSPHLMPNISRPRAMIVAADPPLIWDNNALEIGVSVSEPLPVDIPNDYYPEPKGGDGKYSAVKDVPMDSETGINKNRPLNLDNEPPLTMHRIGTYTDYKTAFLQRLANPLIPWHVVTNPYITVDWQPIDLTVFNGEANNQLPISSDTVASERPPVRLASRQRGQGGQPAANIWTPHSFDPIVTLPTAIDNHFRHQLQHTLGYLNSVALSRVTPVLTPVTPLPDSSGVFTGAPSIPFPWITWNNRPYVSQMEMMLVPASSPDRLLFEFSIDQTTNPAQRKPVDAYQRVAVDPRTPFGHLLNFFQSTAKSPVLGEGAAKFYRLFEYTHVPSRFVGTETTLDPVVFSGFNGFPLLKMDSFHPPFNKLSNLRDPGRVNINTIYSPAVWRAVLNGHIGPSWEELVASRRGFAVPEFPQLDPRILPAANGLLLPRVPPSIPGGPTPLLRPPTYMANPFRAPDAGQLVPPTFSPFPPFLPFPASPTLVRPGVEGTLLRSNSIMTFDINSNQFIFSAMTYDFNSNQFIFTPPTNLTPPPPPPPTPLFGSLPINNIDPTIQPHNNPRRSAHFRYQGIQRLGNLLTTHSNVFAVWITVGYFEVHDATNMLGLRYPGFPNNVPPDMPPDLVNPNTTPPSASAVYYPDGYSLGRELGSETGEVKRHRAFYMIDRSIPVAYEKGESHNVDRAVLIRRFIE